jgi:hypothetical protein
LYAEGFSLASSPLPDENIPLYKIEFNPIRVSPIPGSTGLTRIRSLAVSQKQDKIVISARTKLRSDLGCGVLELKLSHGKLRKILDDPDCNASQRNSSLSWRSLSLSPDAETAVAIRDRRLELIDLVHGAVRAVGDNFYRAAWSPDGKKIEGTKTYVVQFRQQKRSRRMKLAARRQLTRSSHLLSLVLMICSGSSPPFRAKSVSRTFFLQPFGTSAGLLGASTT